MIIETWIAALFMGLIAVGGVIALFGWMIADQRNEDLTKENKALLKENTQLKSKINFACLYIEMEKKKNA